MGNRTSTPWQNDEMVFSSTNFTAVGPLAFTASPRRLLPSPVTLMLLPAMGEVSLEYIPNVSSGPLEMYVTLRGVDANCSECFQRTALVVGVDRIRMCSAHCFSSQLFLELVQ